MLYCSFGGAGKVVIVTTVYVLIISTCSLLSNFGNIMDTHKQLALAEQYLFKKAINEAVDTLNNIGMC